MIRPSTQTWCLMRRLNRSDLFVWSQVCFSRLFFYSWHASLGNLQWPQLTSPQMGPNGSWFVYWNPPDSKFFSQFRFKSVGIKILCNIDYIGQTYTPLLVAFAHGIDRSPQNEEPEQPALSRAGFEPESDGQTFYFQHDKKKQQPQSIWINRNQHQSTASKGLLDQDFGISFSICRGVNDLHIQLWQMNPKRNWKFLRNIPWNSCPLVTWMGRTRSQNEEGSERVCTEKCTTVMILCDFHRTLTRLHPNGSVLTWPDFMLAMYNLYYYSITVPTHYTHCNPRYTYTIML